jgi:hypothetical protein
MVEGPENSGLVYPNPVLASLVLRVHCPPPWTFSGTPSEKLHMSGHRFYLRPLRSSTFSQML